MRSTLAPAVALALLGLALALQRGAAPGFPAPPVAAPLVRQDGRTVKQKTSETCTTVVVGKGLTEQGNLLHAHNEDLWFDTAQNLLSEPARTVDPASPERFYSVSRPYGVAHTFAFMGSYNFNVDNVPGDIGLGINEHGVMITTNTGHARPEEVVEPEAPLVYSDFIRYALERALTASDAVDLIGAAVEEHGISGDPGLMFFISDPREGWLLEATPYHWVAERCPDDGYLARANRFGITTAGDRRSPTLIADAIDRGWYQPADPGAPEAGFSFRDVYGDPAWNTGPYVGYNEPREDAVERHLAALTAAGGKVSAQELLPLLRSHFEGTSDEAHPPHDRAEDVDYTGEIARRTVCTARTVVSLVAEQDDALPAGMMARWWTAFPAPCTTGYFPIYLAHLGQPFPVSYTNAAEDGTPEPEVNAWWAHAGLVSAVDQDYPRRHPAVRAAFDAFEADILEELPSVEAEAAALYSAGKAAEAAALLNRFTDERASGAFEQAKRLTAEINAPAPSSEDTAEGCACRQPAGRPAGLGGAALLMLAGTAAILRVRRPPSAARRPPPAARRPPPAARHPPPAVRRPPPAAGDALLPHRLHDHALAPLPVELGVEDLLPRPEVQLAGGDRHDDLVVHEDRLQVRVAVVLAGAVVLVIGTLGREVLQPLPDVFPKPGLVIVHEDAGGDVHRAHQHHPLLDAARGHHRGHPVGDVDELALLLRLEMKILGLALHRDHGASGIEPLHLPRVALARVEHPNMKTARLALPELDPVRHHPVASPEGRPRHLLAGKALLDLAHPLEQRVARRQRRALQRRPGADLAASGARREVGVRLGVGHLLHLALHPDLLAGAGPVHAQRRARVRLEIARLAALPVGEEREAARIDALQEDHAHRGAPCGVHGGERHGGGVERLARLALLQELPGMDEGIGGLDDHARRLLRRRGRGFLDGHELGPGRHLEHVAPPRHPPARVRERPADEADHRPQRLQRGQAQVAGAGAQEPQR